MQYAAIDRGTIASNTVLLGSIKASDFDKHLIFIDQTSDANNIDATDLAAITITAVLKKRSGDKAFEQQILRADLYSLAKLTNYQGGVGYLAADKTQMQMLMDAGQISLGAGDEIAYTISIGNMGTIGGSPTISVWGVKTHDLKLPVKIYETFATTGDVNFIDAIELYSTGADSNQLVTIQDGYNQLTINDTVASHLANAIGRYEAYEQFALLWVDKGNTGKDINVKSPTGMTFLCTRVL